nr:MAG TPA: hypothetical protein [Caudoviricetes sp.]
MFYKIAKALSKVTIIFGFVLMVGGGSEKSQELFYLYEALGIVTFAAGAFALECFQYQEHQYRKRKIREAKEHARREAA